ncbi:MAG: hypothetical protein JSW61_06805 [Candidatus Thorarchaeota archaeon]|nr:MAG: hypothetical protein JSW61_06805 [Candidatus Thorarchaeota archaeon]
MRRRILLVVSLLSLVSIVSAAAVVAWHDGIGQLTSISDINDGTIAIGTAVTVKGNITQVLQEQMGGTYIATLSDGTGSLMFSDERLTFSWLYSIVVVRGTVTSESYLRNVTFFDTVWLWP